MFFSVALLVIMLIVGWYSYNDYSGYIANQQELALRSVDSTAREIEVLLDNRRKSVKLFAQREQKLLMLLVEQPDNISAQTLLQTRINAYFPSRLAVSIANEKGQLLLKRGKKLVGNTCRKDIRRFFTSPDDPSIHVHPSPGTPKPHIDILSDTSEIIQDKTVFFVSFFLDDLFRILTHGQVVGHQLTLVRTTDPELIETQNNDTVIELEKLVGTLDKTASVKRGEFRKIWNPQLIKHTLATTPIAGTQWELRDVAKFGLLKNKLDAVMLQAAVIIIIFIIITIAGLRLTKRLQTSRGNTTAVLLRIEEERKRIAMDLHDQVLSDISHIQRECRQISSNIKYDQKSKKSKHLDHDLYNVTKTIRHIIDDLHPHSLNLLGFSETVRAYCSTHMHNHLNIEAKVDINNWQDHRLNDIEKLHLFRILQESIDNVIKHAEASRCDICLKMDGNLMQLIVKDNGIGVSHKNNSLNIGHGITNIKERSRILNAKVSWQTVKDGGGTCFLLEKVFSDE